MVKPYRRPHRYKKRKPIYRSRSFWLVIFVLILFSSLLYLLFLADYFQIKEINIAGLQQVSEEALNSLVKSHLENKILFFSTKSIFSVNSNKIKEEALKKIPLIAQIEIRRNFPDALNVSVTERKGLATFCQESTCFSLDKEGIIFEIDDSLQPLIRTLIPNEEIKLGDKVIEKEKLTQLLEINSYLEKNLNIPAKEFLISSLEKLQVITQEGWELYLNPQEDIKWQLTKLKVLLDEKIPPEKRNDLEWIELRFGNFANPKYKD